MKIVDIETIRFRSTSRNYPTRWGYYTWGEEHEAIGTITKVVTDEGAVGYNLGGNPDVMEHVVKPLLLGENPLNREKLWHWMEQHPGINEHTAGFVD